MKEFGKIQDDARVLEMFQKIKEFSRFSTQDIESFLEMGNPREYQPGEVIIKQGDLDCWVFFLLSGFLEVIQDENVIGKIKNRGELFGEMGVIDASPRSTTVQAVRKSIVLGVDASLMERKEKENDMVFCYTLYRMFSEVLAERLRSVTVENTRLRKELRRFQSARVI